MIFNGIKTIEDDFGNKVDYYCWISEKPINKNIKIIIEKNKK
jgi:hypothetical protein